MKQRIFKRPIRAVLHRSTGKGKSTIAIWTRYYSSVASCLSKGVSLAILDGQPGDVLELSSYNFGYAIATLKLKVGSRGLSSMDIQFLITKDQDVKKPPKKVTVKKTMVTTAMLNAMDPHSIVRH